MVDRTSIAIGLFDAGARAYSEAFMDTSLYHGALDKVCDLIGPLNADVLELGCGPGNITKYVLAMRPDLRILGTDLAPKMLELARINNPEATFQLYDARNIRKLDRSFDAILAGFILPYLTPDEALELISDAHKVLRSCGVLYISTMEDDPARSGFRSSSSGHGSAYIQYYEGTTLIQALQAIGFDVVYVDRKAYAARDGSMTTDVLIVGRKRTDLIDP